MICEPHAHQQQQQSSRAEEESVLLTRASAKCRHRTSPPPSPPPLAGAIEILVNIVRQAQEMAVDDALLSSCVVAIGLLAEGRRIQQLKVGGAGAGLR
jgi:hypothetical protein